MALHSASLNLKRYANLVCVETQLAEFEIEIG